MLAALQTLQARTGDLTPAMRGIGEPMSESTKTRKGSFPIPSGDIPPRPFLGLSDEDEREVLAILEKHLQLGILALQNPSHVLEIRYN